MGCNWAYKCGSYFLAVPNDRLCGFPRHPLTTISRADPLKPHFQGLPSEAGWSHWPLTSTDNAERSAQTQKKQSAYYDVQSLREHSSFVFIGRIGLRNRQEITWTFGCPIAPHLWPLLNRQILTVAHYTSGLAQSARPNLRHT